MREYLTDLLKQYQEQAMNEGHYNYSTGTMVKILKGLILTIPNRIEKL